MDEPARIEAHVDGAWRPAAEVRLRGGSEDRGAPTTLDYDLDHALAYVDGSPLAAVSVRHPVAFDVVDLPTFPGFCVDLIPQGVARRRLEGALRREGLAPTDWALLLRGAGSPIGNLRLTSAAHEPDEGARGLPRGEVVRRGEAFVEWAERGGVPMRGATDTVGASPKLLLTEDEEGLLHADGVLPDRRACRHWMVKFPRGRSVRDQQVLASEPAYLEVARRLGVRCAGALRHESGALFVPRFDRVVTERGVLRLGVESVYSVLGVVEAGAALRWEDVCAGVAAVVDDPAADVAEIVLRDALSLALGNPDNHGRNTSVLKTPDGVALSPLYDFAPMFLDPEGIVRTTRWGSEAQPGGLDWRQVVRSTEAWVAPDALTERLLALREGLGEVAGWLAELGVDEDVVDGVRPRLERTALSLSVLGGGSWGG